MNILDIKCMLDICRYQKINVNAKSPAKVYPDETAMRAERNAKFLASCVRNSPKLTLLIARQAASTRALPRAV